MPSLIKNIAPLHSYLKATETPLIIAGPCSAESERQVLDTATSLAKIPQLAAYRCGVWKPRSRPGEFEGVGEKALGWLERAKEMTGLPICVEVALPAHIEACLRHNVDILWIGSRTVVNPFSVNEIASALKGVDTPVFVKNPVNPDLQLWIGALERMSQQGIRKLAAVHRGFSVYGSKPYRNLPVWNIPIELRRLIPELPVLIDPSHISGSRSMLPHVSQAALDLSFDGLMIEAHIQPDEALTDKRQQISPAALEKMIRKLKVPAGKNTENTLLKSLREEIDRLDEEILQLLGQRMEAVGRIGKYKRERGMEILQLERWQKVVKDRIEMGSRHGLSRHFLMNVLQAIHEESLRRQQEKE